jgi:hypothetical protein
MKFATRLKNADVRRGGGLRTVREIALQHESVIPPWPLAAAGGAAAGGAAASATAKGLPKACTAQLHIDSR